MKRLSMLLSATLAAWGAFAAEITLASAGKTDYRVLLKAPGHVTGEYAVTELQRWLKEMTGADFIRAEAGDPATDPLIVLAFAAEGEKPAGKALGPEGYALEVKGKSLHITGGGPRGLLYGVYGLLEDHFGCHWFTPEISSIPKREPLALPALSEATEPVLEYREPFVKECFDGDWAARNRMNGNTATLEDRHGGKIIYNGFVHTFNALVPPDKYYDEHPEYFALVGGKRLKDRSQLCCTNEDVVRIITEGILQWIADKPEATVFSVSQNDWFYYCECDACQAVATAEDSQIGPVLQLVNKVARAVGEKHPDKAIDTLAYQWTRKPPKNMRPEPNVIVRLCSIECCFSHPFTTCDSPMNKAFVEDVKGWAKKCDRLWVWDYTTTFSAYVNPFPNLRVRKPNIQFFVDHNVTGIFEQDVYNTTGGELAGLSGYLGAKLLWDPAYDAEKAIDDYLQGVYGPAAAPIREYLNALHDKVEKDNFHMNIWITPEAEFLTPELMAHADACFDRAEAAAKDDEALLQRVRIARMPVDYVQIEHARHNADDLAEYDHHNLVIRPRAELQQRIERFIAAGKAVGITEMRESGLPWADYIAPLPGLLTTQQLTLVAPAQSKGFSDGLRFSYFPGKFTKVADFGAGKPERKGYAKTVSMDEIGKLDDAFGVIFSGVLRVKRAGIYTFHLASNDGAVLYVSGQTVADNDGEHKLQVASGHIALDVGLHPIAVRYFQSGGEKGLTLEYAGPNIEKQPIPANVLFFDAKDELRAEPADTGKP